MIFLAFVLGILCLASLSSVVYEFLLIREDVRYLNFKKKSVVSESVLSLIMASNPDMAKDAIKYLYKKNRFTKSQADQLINHFNINFPELQYDFVVKLDNYLTKKVSCTNRD